MEQKMWLRPILMYNKNENKTEVVFVFIEEGMKLPLPYNNIENKMTM